MNSTTAAAQPTSNINALMHYVKPHKALILLAILAIIAFSIVDAGMLYFVKPLIDDGLSQSNSKVLQLGALLVLVIFLLRGITSFIAHYAISYTSSKITYTIRQQVFEKMQILPMTFFNKHTTGSLIAKITFDAEQLAGATSNALLIALRESLIITVLLAMMIYQSWQLSLIFLIIGPVIAFIVNHVSKRFKRISTNIQTVMGDITSATEQSILNHQQILASNSAEQVSEQFAVINNKNRQQTMKLAATAGLGNPIVQLIASVAISTVLLIASFPALLSELTPGTFTLVLVAMGSLLRPLKQLTQVNQQWQRGMAAATSLFAILAQKNELNEGRELLHKGQHSLSLSALSFTYEDGKKNALHQVSLTIPAGEKLALVGESGSGKTTLANLILRFYNSPKNSLYINNIAIEHYDITSLRSQISLVSQHIVLIDDTLANNIRFGCQREVTNNEVIQAAKNANVWSFANQLPNGINSHIGENGKNLSGGQRQRIAIARAMLRDTSIIILDEATSALDSQSEHAIQQAFNRLAKNKTMIIIAHRLSTIKQADNIAVLSQGHVIEQGNHQQLIDREGKYYQLWQQQEHSKEQHCA